MLDDIAVKYKVTREHVVRPGRLVTDIQVRAMGARAEFMHALRGRKWSYPAIGWLLGLDHTTVMSALKKWEAANANKLPASNA